jgi:hypothetical protein
MGKPSAPAPPDYVGAANAQGAANKEAAIATAKLSNPWTTTPLGSRQVDYSGKITGDEMVPFITDSLTPLGQQRQDQENRIIYNLGETAESGLGRVSDAFSSPMEFGDIGQLQDTAQESILARLRPQMQMDEASLENRLANQGLQPGSEAYNNAYRQFGERKNDAYSQAALQAIGLQPQLMQQSLAIRNQPLNELNALRTGSQVTLPQFQQFRGAEVGAAPVYSATAQAGQDALGQYNANMAYNSALIGGLLQAGGTAGGAAIIRSDRRVKRDIRRIGTSQGWPIYTFRYIDRDALQVGVMAQDVEATRPDAVVEIDGVKHVNYGRIFNSIEPMPGAGPFPTSAACTAGDFPCSA